MRPCAWWRHFVVIVALVAAGALAAAPAIAESNAEVEAEGVGAIYGGDEARARDEAVVDAYRRALEAGGVHVQALTFVRNFQALADQVSTSTQGYLKGVRVVGEGRDGALYRVRIRAVVVHAPLGDDPQGVAALLALAGRPRVALAFDAADGAAAPVEAEAGAVLAGLGYHVIDLLRASAQAADQLRRLDPGGDPRLVVALGVNAQADVLVVGSVRITAGGPVRVGNEVLSSAHAALAYRVLVAATGQQVDAGAQQAAAAHVTAATAALEAARRLGALAGGHVARTIPRRYSPVLGGVRSVQIIVLSSSYEQVLKVLWTVRAARDVDGQAYLRAFESGIGVIDVRASTSTAAVVARLQAAGTRLRVVALSENRAAIEVLR
ncbi:MAG: hypothetical protein HY660_14170 [Armatimonadetes bacterium]|nr:hypothetical protein [Armatimonadota bacterium]